MSLLKIAHVPPATVEPGATVFEAVSVMAREGVGAVAVVEKAAKSQLQGIFTERDVMLRVVQQERNPRETQVGDVMTSPVEAASGDTFRLSRATSNFWACSLSGTYWKTGLKILSASSIPWTNTCRTTVRAVRHSRYRKFHVSKKRELPTSPTRFPITLPPLPLATPGPV